MAHHHLIGSLSQYFVYFRDIFPWRFFSSQILEQGSGNRQRQGRLSLSLLNLSSHAWKSRSVWPMSSTQSLIFCSNYENGIHFFKCFVLSFWRLDFKFSFKYNIFFHMIVAEKPVWWAHARACIATACNHVQNNSDHEAFNLSSTTSQVFNFMCMKWHTTVIFLVLRTSHQSHS